MKKIDIHLHLQNHKGLMEVSSPVEEMIPGRTGHRSRCIAFHFRPVE